MPNNYKYVTKKETASKIISRRLLHVKEGYIYSLNPGFC